MAWVETERQALVQTLTASDPDAPTLCEGWDVRHVLAHLVQREHSPGSMIGDLVVKRKPGEEKYLGQLVDTAKSPLGYAALIKRFEAGPPRWSPLRWAGESINLIEYMVHHEDVRRGAGLVAPRDVPAAEADAVWAKLPTLVRLSYRTCPVGVTLSRPGGQSHVVKTGQGSVLLTGEPIELALYVTGRRSAAQVQVSGTPADVETFEGWTSRR